MCVFKILIRVVKLVFKVIIFIFSVNSRGVVFFVSVERVESFRFGVYFVYF